ncbi:MAG: pre-peptidase C-terminal domain-containing protein [Planctomycetaceae bacterium]|nr:pre-peptidase C-terminal domain-containing protein [Planctomycetales bacterium]MCB9936853.1 pre-peptidase C-terminal domain-containing protein [Planctomycetaceae bacterium]
MPSRCSLQWLVALSLSLLAVPVFAASPRLTRITPAGIQRGAEHEVTFSGNNLGDAQEIFFYHPGFEVTKVEGNGNTCKATIKVAADCRLGEHVAQVRTATGISDFRVFYVGALPAVDEKEPNTDFAAPQAIDMNVTVQGVVQGEDVDYYVVEAKKGQRISAEVEGMRLGITMFDPYVAILDEKRFELSASDDTPLLGQDCAASVVAPEDGKYFIEVRESAYGGNGNCLYRLHVGSFPRPLAVYPAGGQLGQELEVKFLGDPTGEKLTKVTLPAEDELEFGLFASDETGISPSPTPFRLFEHGNAFEQEPNNGIAEATPVELPLAFNGILEQEGDVDCFKFAAKKGQVFEVECYGRRIRSAIDPVMNLYQADGKSIAGNDDSRGPDSYIRFSVPADGDYVVRITDHLGRGGADFVYRVEFQPVKPKLTLGIPRVERYGQYRQTVYVAKGNKVATIMNATRENFGGDLVLDGTDLPTGVTMQAETMPANMNVMPILFEAAADAPLSGKLVDFRAKHADPNQNITGGFFNRADFVISAPGQSRYSGRDVNKLAIAVVDTLPFTLEIIEPKVPIVRNGVMQLKVVAHRTEEFKTAINVQFPFRPPGIGTSSSVNIPEGQSEVLYPLNANGGAQVKDWKVFALGSANIGGNAWVSSQLATLRIAEPYVTAELQRASCEQGQELQVYCKLNITTPFEGNAKAELIGLPNKVTSVPLEFNKDAKELTFPVTTDPASPAGKHKNILCRVTIIENGEEIVSTAGTVEIQIDQPLPAPAKPAPMPAAPAAAAAPAEQPKPAPVVAKPLTRLEKLRLAAEERKKAKAAGQDGG